MDQEPLKHRPLGTFVIELDVKPKVGTPVRSKGKVIGLIVEVKPSIVGVKPYTPGRWAVTIEFTFNPFASALPQSVSLADYFEAGAPSPLPSVTGRPTQIDDSPYGPGE